jgi:hypothetical protein
VNFRTDHRERRSTALAVPCRETVVHAGFQTQTVPHSINTSAGQTPLGRRVALHHQGTGTISRGNGAIV